MEVILKQDINKLGSKDELVSVKAGFARNFLLPQGMALEATVPAKKMLAETIKQRAHKEEKIKAEALKNVESLKKSAIKVKAKVGEEGRIFGSINTIQLADAIEALGVIVDRKTITIKEEPIKKIGKYTASIKFYKDVVETIEFEVVEG